MALLDWFRNLFSGSPHLHDTTDDSGEVEGVLSEEYGTPAAGDVSVEQMEQTSLGVPSSEAAGAAADDLASLETPPDPDP